jgi:hypothetical protein
MLINRYIRLVLCVISLLVVAGCGSLEVPSAGKGSAATATVASTKLPPRGQTVRPGEKAPTEPDAAKVNDDQGALAFATYWEAALDWAVAAGDSSELNRLMAPVCYGCTSALQTFGFIRSVGGVVTGGRFAASR